jgi:hypothetical protein
MTELEAVNTLLSIIGEAPVDQLSDLYVNEITDSTLARRTLHEVSRDVQSEGWSWNTDYNVPLSKDNLNQYPLPSNTLSAIFSPNHYPDMQYVARGGKVYDRRQRTFAFGASMVSSLIVDQLVSQLDWDEVPHQAQQYVVIRAGRIFSDRYLNSNAIYVYTAQDEEYARTMLIRSEEQQLNNNMLWGNDRGIGQGIGYIPAEGTRFRIGV